MLLIYKTRLTQLIANLLILAKAFPLYRQKEQRWTSPSLHLRSTTKEIGDEDE